MTISSAGTGRQPITVQRAVAKRDEAEPGVSAAPIGALVGGGALAVGGLALRAAGHGRLGFGFAAVGGALLGATILGACAATQVISGVPGDRGPVHGTIEALPESIVDLPSADATNPAPANWMPQTGMRDAREGVVHIEARAGFGSGWVVAPGQVITNYHVAQGNRIVRVTDHNGRSHDGTVLRMEREHDLALIRVPGLKDTPLKMDDLVTRGEGAETTGYPNGEFSNDTATATSLIDVKDDDRRGKILLFAGHSEPGISGGALINGAGEVLGTVFAVGDMGTPKDPSEIVLAIPNDDVRRFLSPRTTADTATTPQ